MSFSSCLAMLGTGLLVTTTSIGSRRIWKEGAAREAQMRALHAKEAAAARKHYNELMRDSPPASDTPAPPALPLGAEPTAPPLVPLEPMRQPLRPR